MHLSHLLVITSMVFAVPAMADDKTVHPSTELSPQQVVEIVVKALQENDADDTGIATVFRFASPGNKANTGPLERFSGMIKKGFGEMLNHAGSRTGEMKIDGKTALQPVYLTTPGGLEIGYMFQIGEQTDGEYKGMWMTEAVYPLPHREQSI